MNLADLKKAIGVKAPITAGQISLAINGSTSSGSEGALSWMGPFQPIQAQQQQVAGRAWDFPVGVNLQYTPRGTEPISFDQLRALADNYDIIRLLIETRKDEMVKIKFNVQPIDSKQKSDNDPRVTEIEDFLRRPDKRTMWQPWLRALLEDLLVIDAATIYPRMTKGGDLFSLELLDGASIKRVIDDYGRQPFPPQPAFQQILKGVPAADYTVDELIYAPRNIRTHKLYGYSPVEQIVMTVNIGLRRQLSQLQYYTAGSTPDLIFSMPSTWNTDQIKEYQTYWNTMLEGNSEARRGTKFIPDGVKPFNTKDQILKDDYDEWLVRVCCFAFSIPPSAFTHQMNRATAQSAQESAIDQGLIPLMQWVKDLMDMVIWKYFGYTDLTFAWEEEESQDPQIQSAIIDQKLRNGTMSVNEARTIDGLDPIPGADKLMIYTGAGAVPLEVAMATTSLNPTDVPNSKVNGESATGNNKPIKTENAPKSDAHADATGEGSTGIGATKLLKKKHLHKATKVVTPFTIIDPDRTSILKTQKELQTELEDFLSSQGVVMSADLAKQISRSSSQSDIEELLQGIDFTAWVGLAKIIEPMLETMWVDGANSALIQIGQDATAFNVVSDNAVSYAQSRSAEMVGMKWVDGELVTNPDASWAITDSTRDMIRGTIAEAQSEGWSTDQVATALQESYPFSTARAQNIARTETALADTQGNLAGWKASGVVQSKQWIVGQDCCDLCEELDGIVVDLDEDFPNDGSDGPPLHTNCRCAIAPIVSNSTEQE